MRPQRGRPAFPINIPPCLLCDFDIIEENLITWKGIYTTFLLGVGARVLLKPTVLPKSPPCTIFLLL